MVLNCHTAHPSPIDSICDITGTKKPSEKSAAFKYVACRISYKVIAMYVYTYIIALFIQDIWHDCMMPQEKYNAFNISNKYF